MTGLLDELDAIKAELDAFRAENDLLREALQHAHAALDSLMSDEMPYTESCRIWRTAVESIREALGPYGQKRTQGKGPV